ncbi:hypothetical protein CDV31_007862 [Fusarium ambrosium]|uniref:C2H2-type domain-containing protein n=1 Tax=Fusarium ambrosium TaxID=131363 RepID=A0A428U499_9HYPO|nr:hypothetical protein CDV31_007862 [Fusarium ambrosium]
MSTESSSSESDDRTSASVLELTQQCISLFESRVNSSQNEDRSALETRLADLRLWADGVGAIAHGTASLDSRFRKRPDDLFLVKTILIMLADFVEDYSPSLDADHPTDDMVTLQHLDSTIENLALIGVAIRRTGKASRRRRADTRFDSRDYEELRRHLECIVLLRPSKSGLQTELEPSTMGIVQNRLVEANLKRRHRFAIARKRVRKVEDASQPKKTDDISASSKEENKKAGPQTKKGPPTMGGLTAASTAEGTLQYGGSGRYVPGAARTQITALAADAEFPRPPKNPAGRHIGKCPCCCQSILVEEMNDSTKWRQHIIEDLLPYTCIIEDCPTPETALFSTRQEWEAHVKNEHKAQWRCPLCQDKEVTVGSEEAIVHHFRTEHQDAVKELTLDTLLPWSETRPMGIKSCPLCSFFKREDSPEILDHVLRHVYEFSLRALPWTKPINHELSKPIGTFNIPTEQDHAARLVEWLDKAKGGTATQLEISTWDVDKHDTNTLEGPDDAGYVPGDEYFDFESVGKSSRPQMTRTEPSRHSISAYHSLDGSREALSAPSEGEAHIQSPSGSDPTDEILIAEWSSSPELEGEFDDSQIAEADFTRLMAQVGRDGQEISPEVLEPVNRIMQDTLEEEIEAEPKAEKGKGKEEEMNSDPEARTREAYEGRSLLRKRVREGRLSREDIDRLNSLLRYGARKQSTIARQQVLEAQNYPSWNAYLAGRPGRRVSRGTKKRQTRSEDSIEDRAASPGLTEWLLLVRGESDLSPYHQFRQAFGLDPARKQQDTS